MAAKTDKAREQAVAVLNTAAEGIRTPLLAALGAGDLATKAVVDAVNKARTRVNEGTHNAKDVNAHSRNLFFTGDNLEVLKHLEHAYTGSIDMIYIDPPYNTGNDGFVYEDNFKFTDDQLRNTLGLTEEEVKKSAISTVRQAIAHG